MSCCETFHNSQWVLLLTPSPAIVSALPNYINKSFIRPALQAVSRCPFAAIPYGTALLPLLFALTGALCPHRRSLFSLIVCICTLCSHLNFLLSLVFFVLMYTPCSQWRFLFSLIILVPRHWRSLFSRMLLACICVLCSHLYFLLSLVIFVHTYNSCIQ